MPQLQRHNASYRFADAAVLRDVKMLEMSQERKANVNRAHIGDVCLCDLTF